MRDNVMKTRAVITDLDNTLFDWVDIWHASFKAMLDQLVKSTGIAEDVMIEEFKAVFTKYGTTEYAFAIEELPSLRRKHPDGDLTALYQDAIHAFRSARQKHMRLYPTVHDTLTSLKTSGCLIAGYTESFAFYSAYRLKTLDLDGVIDVLYSPPDHELPAEDVLAKRRQYPAEHYRLQKTAHHHTPAGAKKPAPEILLGIIKDLKVEASTAIYVGDSLMKDV